MKIAPLGHRILVRMAQIEDRDPAFKKAKAAGIMFADHEDGKRREGGVDRGWVLAVGDDAFRGYHLNSYGTLESFKPWCKEGDYIAFAKYAGMKITLDSDETNYLIINDEDVVATLEDPNE